MNYIYMAALFAGGCWTGYLLGQFSSIKEMNRRLNAQQSEITKLRKELGLYKPEREANGKFASKKKRVLKELQDYVAGKAS